MGDTLRNWSACEYPSSHLMESRGAFSDERWSAKKLVSAIKGDPFEGTANVPVPIGSPKRVLSTDNREEAFVWFAEMVVAKWPSRSTHTLLVPIPPHDAVSERDVMAGRTWKLAEQVAERVRRLHPTVLFHWRLANKSARGGGTREPSEIRANVQVLPERTRSKQVILLDDVVTTGGHLIGCASSLRDAGFELVSSVCVGRTVSTMQEAPFAWKLRKLDLLPPSA